MPEILQDVRERDDKARTFALSDEMKELAETTKAILKLGELKTPKVSTETTQRIIAKMKKPQDLERERIFENMNKYKDINLNDVDNLIKEIKENITIGNNIVDLGNGKEVYFNDLFIFLQDVKDGKINSFNKEKKYNEKFKDVVNKLENRKNYSKNIRLYEKYLNDLKNHQAEV